MYNFLILLIIFMNIYLKLTNNYVNPYKLIMVFGKKGSGKTTYLTKQAYKHLKRGWKVFSTVAIPGTELFDVNEISKGRVFPEHSLVLIDEVGIIWDNRNFKNFSNNTRDYFKFQRQYKNKVILFSQTFDIDLKLRNLTDTMYLLKNVARVFSVARRIDKRITIQNGEDGKASSLVDDYQFAPILSSGSLDLTFIPRWVPFFASYDPPLKDYVTSDLQVMTLEQHHLLNAKYFLYYKLKKYCITFFKRIKARVLSRYKRSDTP